MEFLLKSIKIIPRRTTKSSLLNPLEANNCIPSRAVMCSDGRFARASLLDETKPSRLPVST